MDDTLSRDRFGITPFNFRNSGTYEPISVFSHLAPWQVVAHETGHTFKLPHYTTDDGLTDLNPNDYIFGFDYVIAALTRTRNNLMCGGFVCPGTPNTDLTADQIIKAVAAATMRAK